MLSKSIYGRADFTCGSLIPRPDGPADCYEVFGVLALS